jgi:tripartite-type tricarboxylate transporter receptor subunit TctC
MMGFCRRIGACALLFFCSLGLAQAQQYPTRPITIIVPTPPGGILDVYSRWIGHALEQRWGQSVIVENRTGAGGWIGIQALEKAAPDGYTLMAGASAMASLPIFVKGASFEPGKDFVPLTGVLYAPYVIITNTKAPAKTLSEFIAYAKANPGKLNMAVVPGSGQQVDELDFLAKAGIDMAVIPYQGGAPALRSVIADETQAYFGAVLGLEENVKAGRITPLAVTGTKRFPSLPDVPTVKEATGIDFETFILYALFAAPGTPDPIADKLRKEITDIVNNSEVNGQIKQANYEPMTTTGEELGALIRKDLARGREIARTNNLQAQ